MAREFARDFYGSKAWTKCRASFIKIREGIDGGMCEMCGENHGYIVHHKIKLTQSNISNTDISLGVDNLMYLCLECHNIIHGKPEEIIQDAIEYCFDEFGNVIPKNY